MPRTEIRQCLHTTVHIKYSAATPAANHDLEDLLGCLRHAEDCVTPTPSFIPQLSLCRYAGFETISLMKRCDKEGSSQ